MTISSRETKESIALKFIEEAKKNGDIKSKGFKEFKNTPKDDLNNYHHSMGRNIRNYYSLWDPKNPLTENWHNNPESRTFIGGVDFSDDHPDSVSMDIIKIIWEKVQ